MEIEHKGVTVVGSGDESFVYDHIIRMAETLGLFPEGLSRVSVSHLLDCVTYHVQTFEEQTREAVDDTVQLENMLEGSFESWGMLERIAERRNPEVLRMVRSTAKLLESTTVFLSGVARRVDSLLREHPTVESDTLRKLVESVREQVEILKDHSVCRSPKRCGRSRRRKRGNLLSQEWCQRVYESVVELGKALGIPEDYSVQRVDRLIQRLRKELKAADKLVLSVSHLASEVEKHKQTPPRQTMSPIEVIEEAISTLEVYRTVDVEDSSKSIEKKEQNLDSLREQCGRESWHGNITRGVMRLVKAADVKTLGELDRFIEAHPYETLASIYGVGPATLEEYCKQRGVVPYGGLPTD